MCSEKPSPQSLNAEEQAWEMALNELAVFGIEPDSASGKEFLFRVGVFGINTANPPRPELNLDTDTVDIED